MQQNSTPAPGSGKVLLFIMLLLEAFALPTQFYLIMATGQYTPWEAHVRFFSYFTILSNTMVGIATFFLVLGKPPKPFAFFRRHTVVTAITVYILIVGIVYNILLRPIVHAEGIHRLVTESFHTIVPLLFLWFWCLQKPQQYISWRSIVMWQIYPLIYVLYTLVHGHYSGFYPYPFVDVNKLGFTKAMTNGCFIVVAFVLLSIILSGISNWRIKKMST